MTPELLLALGEIKDEMYAIREEVRVGFAKLPSSYVSRVDMQSARREAAQAKRWAVGVGLASFFSFAALLVGFF